MTQARTAAVKRFSILLSALVLVSVPAAGRAQEQAAQAHIEKGLAAASAGDTMLAFAELEKARDVAPRMGDVHYHIGRLYTRKASAVETDFRDRLKAEEALLRALEISPSDPRYLLELAQLRMKQHMKVDAGRLFDRALNEAEKLGDPEILAELYFRLGYIKELWYRTLEHRRFNPMFRGSPQDQLSPLAYYGGMGLQGPTRYGNDYLDSSTPIEGSGQIAKEEMIERYRAALRYDPKHVGASIRLMGQLLDEYRLSEYVGIARRLVAAHTERPMPYLYLGLGLHTAGREDAAAQAFENGLKRLPDDERAEIESLEQVMRRTDAQTYLALDDDSRSSFNERYWGLSDPLYLTEANERWLEHLSRVAYADLRFSAPEAGLRGWETDQGIIYVRYGPPESIATFAAEAHRQANNPFATGRHSIIWSYGADGPVLIFRQMPGYMNARFAGDYKFIAENVRYIQPSVYNNIPSIPRLLDLPIQIARFRGATPEEVAVEVHAAVPLEDLARGIDLETGEFEIGLFLLDPHGDEVLRRVSTEVVEYKSAEVDEYKSWRLILPPSEPLVCAVETRDAVSWRAASARERIDVEAFPADSFAVSDILVADFVKPLVEEPRKRADYEVWPNAALEFRSGEPIHIYYEMYGLERDAEGFASFDVSIQVRVKRLKRGAGFSALLGLLADAWGFSIVGDDRLELRYSRQIKMDGRDRVTEYLSLDPQEVPAGDYEIRLRIWDGLGERMARRLRSFEVVNEE
jgi:GWxTD domain-containing protein